MVPFECVYQSQQSSICVYSKEVESLTRRWFELLKDYDMSVIYNLGKGNVIVDALSRMTMGTVSHVGEYKIDLVKYVHMFP